jgi:hypothetical protein
VESSHSISRNRLFITCSFGLLPPPLSQLRSLPTLTMCWVTGCLTRMVNRVAGPNVASANPQRRNSVSARNGRFVDRCGGNFDRVVQAFGIGERDRAIAGAHGFQYREDKANEGLRTNPQRVSRKIS